MNIWIVCEGEPLPIAGQNGRLMRGGMFATQLADLGYHITWWSSTYLHYEKRYVSGVQQTLQVNPKLTLKLLHSSNGYQKNISIKRIKYSKDLALEFKKQSRQEEKPDIIYCSWPLVDFSYEAIKYGIEFNVPVVIDIRDFWPDIFIQPFPKFFQPIAKLGVRLLFKNKVSYVMKSATAVIGVIPKALDFAKSYGRELQLQDHVVHLAYDSTPFPVEEIEKADLFWSSQGLSKECCIVSFISTMNSRLNDFETLFEVVNHFSESNVRFVFCGIGNYFEELQKKAEFMPNLIVPGYRNRAELQSLLKMSTFGLIPIKNTDDFIDALPNKFGEYLSEGVIVLTSLKGLSRELVEKENCGVYYYNSQSLIDSIESIRTDQQKINVMSNNAKDLFMREFDAEAVYSDFYIFLEKLIDEDIHKRSQ